MPTLMTSLFGSTFRPDATAKAGQSQQTVRETISTKRTAESSTVDPSGAPRVVSQKSVPNDGIVMTFGKNKLLLGKVVGSGSFGTVRMVGEQNGKNVKLFAVKAIRDTPVNGETSIYEAGQTAFAAGKRFRHEMARQEIDVLQKAGSPLVPKFFLTDERNTTAFIVMPLMTGTLEELASTLPRQASATRTALANHALPLFGALADLHSRGIAHMDIKPANIFVAQDLSLVLGDFGLATTNDKDYGARGTPIYMAPEVFGQFKGLQNNSVIGLVGGTESPYVASSYATRPTDLYSLGLTVLTLLTGRNPVNYWDYNINKIPYMAGMRAIHNMHFELGKAETQLNAWRSGKSLPSSMKNALNFKPAHRQLLMFFKELSGVDAKQPGVAAALMAVSLDPTARLETLGYKAPLAPQTPEAAIQLLAENMPSAVNEALKDCPLLGLKAREAVTSGQRSLFDFTPAKQSLEALMAATTLSEAPSQAEAPVATKRQGMTFGSVISLKQLFKSHQSSEATAAASASIYSLRRLFKTSASEQMDDNEVQETLANEVVML